MAKPQTWDQVERMKAKAVRFVQDVLKDDDRADEIEAEPVESYAERKHITIQNPLKGTAMAQSSKAELQARIAELEEENAELNDRLDAIADMVSTDDDDFDDSKKPWAAGQEPTLNGPSEPFRASRSRSLAFT